MTLQAAIKKGREMRRKAWPEGQWIQREGDAFWCGVLGLGRYSFTVTDILAHDWEVHS
jgi:hypothetical protein